MVWYLRLFGVVGGGRKNGARQGRFAAIKSLLEVVRNEVGALEKQVYVVRAGAFHTVGSGYPCCVFRRGPVQFRVNTAPKLRDRACDCGVDIRPLE